MYLEHAFSLRLRWEAVWQSLPRHPYPAQEEGSTNSLCLRPGVIGKAISWGQLWLMREEARAAWQQKPAQTRIHHFVPRLLQAPTFSCLSLYPGSLNSDMFSGAEIHHLLRTALPHLPGASRPGAQRALILRRLILPTGWGWLLQKASSGLEGKTGTYQTGGLLDLPHACSQEWW